MAIGAEGGYKLYDKLPDGYQGYRDMDTGKWWGKPKGMQPQPGGGNPAAGNPAVGNPAAGNPAAGNPAAGTTLDHGGMNPPPLPPPSLPPGDVLPPTAHQPNQFPPNTAAGGEFAFDPSNPQHYPRLHSQRTDATASPGYREVPGEPQPANPRTERIQEPDPSLATPTGGGQYMMSIPPLPMTGVQTQPHPQTLSMGDGMKQMADGTQTVGGRMTQPSPMMGGMQQGMAGMQSQFTGQPYQTFPNPQQPPPWQGPYQPPGGGQQQPGQVYPGGGSPTNTGMPPQPYQTFPQQQGTSGGKGAAAPRPFYANQTNNQRRQ